MPMVSGLPAVSGAVTHVVEISGQTVARTVFGIANEIVQSANKVRVNKDVATAVSRHVKDIASVITSSLDDVGQHGSANSGAFETFSRTLEEINNSLVAQAQSSYLSQLLYQQRNKETLVALSDKVDMACRTFVAQLGHGNSVTAIAMTSQLETLLANQSSNLTTFSATLLQEKRIAQLPPQPQFHFGRMDETQSVVDAVTGKVPGRVAILGGPGMGKTSLAVAVLHHPAVAALFSENRFFIPCDAAEGHSSCIAVIAEGLGIATSDPRAAEQQLRDQLGARTAIVVLDNFESAWEADAQRSSAEHVLQILTELETVSLIITLRGAERPAGVRWTRPFLAPLSPLSDVASKQTFLTIADVEQQNPAAQTLLKQMDNVPLAVVLTANLAQYEAPETLLKRWNDTKTAMLIRGDGSDRLSSLDVSIRLSLKSPNLLTVPSAIRLLSVLSLLPHGAVDSDLQFWNIDECPRALSALLQTALASRGAAHRIHVLAPIREFMLSYHAPSEAHATPVYRHYFELAELAALAQRSASLVLKERASSDVAPELSNIESVILHAFRHATSMDLHEAALKAFVCLCKLYMLTGIGSVPDLLPTALSVAETAKLDDLRADILHQRARMSFNGWLSGDPQSLFRQALEIYERTGNVQGTLESRIALTAFLAPKEAVSEARQLFDLAQLGGDQERTARCAQQLGLALERDGFAKDAIPQHELAIEIVQQMDASSHTNRIIGYSKYRIAEDYRWIGEMDNAVKLYEQALPISEAAQYPLMVSVITTQLAETLLVQGRPLEAIAHADRAIAAHIAAGTHSRTLTKGLLVVSLANAMAGRPDAALAAAERADECNQPEGGRPSTMENCDVLHVRGIMALSRGDLVEARDLLSAARAMAREEDMVASRETMLIEEAVMTEALAHVELADGYVDRAAVLAVCALLLFRTTNRTPDAAQCLAVLAEAVDDELAELLINAVLLPLQRMGLWRAQAIALLRSATIAHARGDFATARHRARNALRRFGDVRDHRHLLLAEAVLGEHYSTT